MTGLGKERAGHGLGTGTIMIMSETGHGLGMGLGTGMIMSETGHGLGMGLGTRLGTD
jgi:hypothetical protein